MSVTVLKSILPKVFSKDGWNYSGCSVDSEYGGGDQFQSNIIFVTVNVLKHGEEKTIPVVVKFEPFDKEVQKQLRTFVQFHNEVLMYTELLPLLNRKNILETIFPKFYHGVSTLTVPEDDVIIIEDLRPKGFKMTEQRGFIDYDHLKLAMEKLGSYHALTYIAKKENPKEFHQLVKCLKEPTWVDDSLAITPTIRHCFHRAIDPLIAAGQHTEILQKLLSRVEGSVMKFLLELVTPEEPLAVLCHGDFCRNNMLFKYHNGKPTDVRFFDIATARYSSPAIDIAFFLFMNSSKEVRSAHWDDLLSAYHTSLTSTLGDVEGPSLEQLKQEVRMKGVYGFVHASFFLPMMLFDNDFVIEELATLTAEEVGARQARIGGEEGTELMVGMVQELVERGVLSLDHPFFK